MSSLKDQVAYVTGSTRGIGWAIARRLCEQGATVVLHGRDPKQVAAKAAQLQEEYGRPVLGVAADFSDLDALRRAFRELYEAHRRLDILVNNAGILGDARLGMISDETLDETWAVNARSAIANTQAAARLMRRRKSGAIVNVTSIVGVQGNDGQSAYAASKAALIGLTRAAAKELAGDGIRVNAVAPGFIATDMVAHLDPETYGRRVAAIKMRRVGQPDDVASSVYFFVSGLSQYVTGQVLGVDGGMDIG